MSPASLVKKEHGTAPYNCSLCPIAGKLAMENSTSVDDLPIGNGGFKLAHEIVQE